MNRKYYEGRCHDVTTDVNAEDGRSLANQKLDAELSWITLWHWMSQ